VELTGSAKNYATIALQSDAFSSNSLIKNPVFSNLTVDDKTRTVSFKLSFSVNIADLSYQTFIDSMIKKQNQAPVTNNQTTP
jgi:polyisoprenoid-binding protein YceI